LTIAVGNPVIDVEGILAASGAILLKEFRLECTDGYNHRSAVPPHNPWRPLAYQLNSQQNGVPINQEKTATNFFVARSIWFTIVPSIPRIPLSVRMSAAFATQKLPLVFRLIIVTDLQERSSSHFLKKSLIVRPIGQCKCFLLTRRHQGRPRPLIVRTWKM
jgi:hypothetical protein